MTMLLNPYSFSPASGGGDPLWESVSSLLPFSGADGATTFPDSAGRTWERNGAVEIDTAFSKFGSSGLFSGGRLDCSDSEISVGPGDYTIETFIRGTQFGASSGGTILDNRAGTVTTNLVVFNPNSSSSLVFFADGAIRVTTSALENGVIYHFAICKVSGVTRVFINGVQQGSNYIDSNDYTFSTLRLGQNLLGSSPFIGHMERFRLSKSARYTANFTPPASPFPNSL